MTTCRFCLKEREHNPCGECVQFAQLIISQVPRGGAEVPVYECPCGAEVMPGTPSVTCDCGAVLCPNCAGYEEGRCESCQSAWRLRALGQAMDDVEHYVKSGIAGDGCSFVDTVPSFRILLAFLEEAVSRMPSELIDKYLEDSMAVVKKGG